MSFPVTDLDHETTITHFDFVQTLERTTKFIVKNSHIHWKSGLRSQVLITASLFNSNNNTPFTGEAHISPSSIAVQPGEVHFFLDIEGLSDPHFVHVRVIIMTFRRQK